MTPAEAAGLPLRHFLLVFDHRRGELIRQHEFSDAEAAMDEYAALEREYDRAAGIEVVLIGADCIETVHRTHANYFQARRPSSPFLAGLPEPHAS